MYNLQFNASKVVFILDLTINQNDVYIENSFLLFDCYFNNSLFFNNYSI